MQYVLNVDDAVCIESIVLYNHTQY